MSVVVAAYDEAATIGACVRSLLRQTYRPLEIVVVDDGSHDATAAIAAAMDGVRVLRQPHRGAGAARNLGARHAIGDILVFVDGDMVCPPEFVERLVAPMLERGVIGTFTKDIRVANGERTWALAHQLGRGLPADRHFPPGFPDRWDNFRAVWRRDFERVGGFDEVGHGEDATLGRKLAALAEAAPGAACYHYEPDTLAEVFRSARWYGRGERIGETDGWRRRYTLPRILLRAGGLAARHRMPSLALYRLVWDAGVLYGAATRHRGPAK